MPRYTIRVSDGSQQDRTIEASDEEEATKAALAAMSLHIASKFPPPENLEIVIMDEQLRKKGTLRFGYEVPRQTATIYRLR